MSKISYMFLFCVLCSSLRKRVNVWCTKILKDSERFVIILKNTKHNNYRHNAYTQVFWKNTFQAFFAKSLNIFSSSVILTIPIAKLFSLSCEIIDRKLVLNFFLRNAVNRLSTSRYSNRAWDVKILQGRKFSELQVLQPTLSCQRHSFFQQPRLQQ